ncbi:MAG: transposase [Chlorobi bacterium]|nr:transposase [Chlorobiota bacterium]
MKIDFNEKVTAFHRAFSDENKCLKLLADLKWEQGFVCRKCGHTNYCKGKSPYSRRCTRCKAEESVTAHTVFHHCKIPMNKALEIAFLICIKPDISSYEISKRIDLRHMTCYSFQKKIINCRDSSINNKLLKKVIASLNSTVNATLN